MKCKYEYDKKCNLKYVACIEPEKCSSFVEDKFNSGKEEDFA